MKENAKDPRLAGKYVMRCKCGRRPYSDRLYARASNWIACNCGRITSSFTTLAEAIQAWNQKRRVRNSQ